MSTDVMKKIIVKISPLLTALFNLCMYEGVFPDILKVSRTVPIFKNGPLEDVSSYKASNTDTCFW